MEKESGRARVNTELVAFHGLRPCQERREGFLLPSSSVITGHDAPAIPHLVSPLYLTELSVY